MWFLMVTPSLGAVTEVEIVQADHEILLWEGIIWDEQQSSLLQLSCSS